MTIKTEAKVLFEEFCRANHIDCQKVIEGPEVNPGLPGGPKCRVVWVARVGWFTFFALSAS